MRKYLRIIAIFTAITLVSGISYAGDIIDNVTFVVINPHENGISIWLHGEVNGSYQENMYVNLLATHPNYKEIFATVLTAKVMNLRGRVDVKNVNSELKEVEGVVLW